MPRAPASIPAGRWRELWHECVGEVDDPGQLELAAVEQLVGNLIAAAAALVEARESPTVTGSQGQAVEHPGFKAAARCESRAMSIARDLGLTPGQRRNSGDNQEPSAQSPFDALDDELAQARKRRSS